MKYQFYSDSGHGWIKVSIKELIQLGIEDKISSCSYMKNDNAYLEEDCDLSIFFETKNLKVGSYKFEDICKINNSNYSKIRSYDSYDIERYHRKNEMIELYNKNDLIRKWINKTLNEKSKCDYFNNKTNYSEISHNGRSWFDNIAKTFKEDIQNTLNSLIEYFQAVNSEHLKDKIQELEKEKVLILEVIQE